MSARRPNLDLDALVTGITGGDRAVLGRAITLVESERSDHQALSQDLITRLLPRTGSSMRVGISGVPGAGKSTFIETLGGRIVDRGLFLTIYSNGTLLAETEYARDDLSPITSSCISDLVSRQAALKTVNIQPDTPVENILAMFDAVKSL